ncbi:cupin domain-containing protein [Kitasatospora sp. NPDC004240]
MSLINVFEAASALPASWNSRLLGQVGTAGVKVLRMDGGPVVVETHEAPEALFVIDGILELLVDDTEVTVGPGEMYWVAAHTPHAVRPGSRGTLVILET